MKNSNDHRRGMGFPLAVAAAMILLAARARAADSPDYQKLVGDKTPALVTVKFIVKMSMGGQSGEEMPSEASGVMIDPKGLVICSNTQMGGMMGLMVRMMGREMGGMDVSPVPSDLKVLVGDDTEGLEARLIARDSDLDLAWIQIKDPGDKKFSSIDFSKGVEPKIGAPLVTLKRLGKYFDRVPTFGETKLAAITKKPRELLIPSTIFSGMGMPVFTPAGEIVGLTVLQVPESDDSSENPMAMLTSMFSMQEAMAPLILPAEEVAKATKRAMEGGSEEKKEGEKKEGEKKEGEKKDEGKEKEK